MDPFVLLGITTDASVDEVRAAWKKLARQHHPDAGGSVEQMQQVNDALRRVLVEIRTRDRSIKSESASTEKSAPSHPPHRSHLGGEEKRDQKKYRRLRSHITRDVSSFTVDCLPVETFEALLLVIAWHGELAIDEPPYLIEAIVTDPFQCWVRFDIVPEAGASTVSVTVASADGGEAISSEDVRDVFVQSLNELDWSQLAT